MTDLTPHSRKDLFYAAMLGMDVETPEPASSEEIYLDDDEATMVFSAVEGSKIYRGMLTSAGNMSFDDITVGGGGTIDTTMSDSSENAVQNKVIKAYADGQVGTITTALNTINSGTGV